jgi:hypothetical protein
MAQKNVKFLILYGKFRAVVFIFTYNTYYLQITIRMMMT